MHTRSYSKRAFFYLLCNVNAQLSNSLYFTQLSNTMVINPLLTICQLPMLPKLHSLNYFLQRVMGHKNQQVIEKLNAINFSLFANCDCSMTVHLP